MCHATLAGTGVSMRAQYSHDPQLRRGVSAQARPVSPIGGTSATMSLRTSGSTGSGPHAPHPRQEKGTRRMVRPPLRLFVLLVVVLTLLGSLGPAAAQEATPPAD